MAVVLSDYNSYTKLTELKQRIVKESGKRPGFRSISQRNSIQSARKRKRKDKKKRK